MNSTFICTSCPFLSLIIISTLLPYQKQTPKHAHSPKTKAVVVVGRPPFNHHPCLPHYQLAISIRQKITSFFSIYINISQKLVPNRFHFQTHHDHHNNIFDRMWSIKSRIHSPCVSKRSELRSSSNTRRLLQVIHC